jgi:hypothetical protein
MQSHSCALRLPRQHQGRIPSCQDERALQAWISLWKLDHRGIQTSLKLIPYIDPLLLLCSLQHCIKGSKRRAIIVITTSCKMSSALGSGGGTQPSCSTTTSSGWDSWPRLLFQPYPIDELCHLQATRLLLAKSGIMAFAKALNLLLLLQNRFWQWIGHLQYVRIFFVVSVMSIIQ